MSLFDDIWHAWREVSEGLSDVRDQGNMVKEKRKVFESSIKAHYYFVSSEHLGEGRHDGDEWFVSVDMMYTFW